MSHLDVIVSVLVSSVKDNFYKLASEGLQLARYLLDVMAETKSDKQVPTVFDAVYEKLLVADTDQVSNFTLYTILTLIHHHSNSFSLLYFIY